MKILITAPTGKVGSEIARSLIKLNIPFIAAGRDNNKIVSSLGSGFEFRHFDVNKADTYGAMMDEVERMFLLGTEGIDSVTKWEKIIDQAVLQKVKHIVFLSSLGAEFVPNRPQRLIELYLQQSGIAFTILRPNFFFQNFSTDDAPSIRNGEIFLPCDDGKISFVDTRDIAAVALAALLTQALNSKTVPITGPASIDHFEVASIFSEVLNKRVTYVNPTNEKYAASLEKEGADQNLISSLLWLYDTVKKNQWAPVHTDFENFIGRKPIELSAFVKDYKEVWRTL